MIGMGLPIGFSDATTGFDRPAPGLGEHNDIVYQGMLGYSAEAVKELKFREIFHTLPAEESAVSVVRAHADLIVELVHEDGSIVRARMSKSALVSGDDPVALATFQDLTERLWVDEL